MRMSTPKPLTTRPESLAPIHPYQLALHDLVLSLTVVETTKCILCVRVVIQANYSKIHFPAASSLRFRDCKVSVSGCLADAPTYKMNEQRGNRY